MYRACTRKDFERINAEEIWDKENPGGKNTNKLICNSYYDFLTMQNQESGDKFKTYKYG